MTEPKLCRDCRWAINRAAPLASPRSFEWYCGHPSSLMPADPPSPVDGSVKPSRRLGCEQARAWEKSLFSGKAEYCGPSGRYWEPTGSGEVGFGEPDK
jgi:hypothetical protein